MKSVMTLTPKEQRSVVRALGSLATIFGDLADNGARPKRRRKKLTLPDPAPASRGVPRTRAAKNPLAHVSD